MLLPDAHSPEVSDEDKPKWCCMQRQESRSVWEGRDKELEKVREDRKCWEQVSVKERVKGKKDGGEGEREESRPEWRCIR